MVGTTRSGSLMGASETKETPEQAGGDLESEARFADTAGTGEGHKTHIWTA